jgi:hypothetical protein
MNTCRQSVTRELCVTGDLLYNVSSLYHCTRQVPGSNTDISWDIELFEDLHSFLQSMPKNSEKVAPLGHYQFLLNLFPFTPSFKVTQSAIPIEKRN